MPDSIRNDLASYVGCISGAIQIDEYKDLLTSAGLQGMFSEYFYRYDDLMPSKISCSWTLRVT